MEALVEWMFAVAATVVVGVVVAGVVGLQRGFDWYEWTANHPRAAKVVQWVGWSVFVLLMLWGVGHMLWVVRNDPHPLGVFVRRLFGAVAMQRSSFWIGVAVQAAIYGFLLWRGRKRLKGWWQGLSMRARRWWKNHPPGALAISLSGMAVLFWVVDYFFTIYFGTIPNEEPPGRWVYRVAHWLLLGLAWFCGALAVGFASTSLGRFLTPVFGSSWFTYVLVLLLVWLVQNGHFDGSFDSPRSAAAGVVLLFGIVVAVLLHIDRRLERVERRLTRKDDK